LVAHPVAHLLGRQAAGLLNFGVHHARGLVRLDLDALLPLVDLLLANRLPVGHFRRTLRQKAPSDLVSAKQMNPPSTAQTMLHLLARTRFTTARTFGSIVGGMMT